MAKASQKTADDTAEQTDAPKNAKAKDYAEITYIPDNGDPVRTTFAGIEFKAYVPVKVALVHAITVGLRKEVTMPDGSIQSRNVDTRISVAELLKGNRFFSVDGVQAAKKSASARVPTDPDMYRGYAISWIAASTNASSMDARWDGEAALRERCGCDDKDIAYLRPFFEARHDECDASAADGGVKAA